MPEMGDFRWLTVGPAGQPDVAIVLMAIPGPPVMDDETAEQVRDLMAKGFAGTVFLTTDDCRASYEELRGRGVEFTEAPEERPYGIDSGFRDPSGNSLRLTQVDGAVSADGPVAQAAGRLARNSRIASCVARGRSSWGTCPQSSSRCSACGSAPRARARRRRTAPGGRAGPRRTARAAASDAQARPEAVAGRAAPRGRCCAPRRRTRRARGA